MQRIPRVRRTACLALLVLVVAAAATACSQAQSTVDPKSDHADTVQRLYLLVFWLAAIVFVAVLGATLAFSVIFRERPGREARQFHGNTRLELLWTLIPVAIVAVIAVPTVKAIYDTAGDPPADAVVVEVTAHQWWFEFHYPAQNITTASEIHLPVDRAASFKLRSDNVIHSFWVPQLSGKMDVVPGHENELWFTPNEARPEPYLGQCAEFCGLAHANMRFRVFVDTADRFDAWVKSQQADRVAPTTDALKAGEQLFLSSPCIACHTVKGAAAAVGKLGPNLTHVGSRSTIAAGIMPNTVEDLIRWISNPEQEKPGVVLMPKFEQSMTREQIASIAVYLQSLK